jgi:hypothetical protein
MRNNKLNEGDCGPKLEIFEDGHLFKHSGPHGGKIKQWKFLIIKYFKGINIIRAFLPIPSLNLKIMNRKIIVSYYEIEILNKIG